MDFVQNTFQSLVVSLVQRAIPRDKTVSGDIRQESQILFGYGAHRTEEVTNNQIDRHVIEDGKRMVDASFGNIDNGIFGAVTVPVAVIVVFECESTVSQVICPVNYAIHGVFVLLALAESMDQVSKRDPGLGSSIN